MSFFILKKGALKLGFAVVSWMSGGVARIRSGYSCRIERSYRTLTSVSGTVQIIEVLLVSLITSLLSFGLPTMTSCKPCPDPVKYPGVTCPRPSGNYGNYVNVSSYEGLLFSFGYEFRLMVFLLGDGHVVFVVDA